MQSSGCRHEKTDPDWTHCRTSSVGALMPGSNKEMFYCSIENADCRYALSIGYDYVCKHSKSHAFAAPGGR